MAVPKRQRSKKKIKQRCANKGLEVQAMTGCLNCKASILPHQVCSDCGFYKGKKIMVTKKERALKRAQTKQSKESKKTIAATAGEAKE